MLTIRILFQASKLLLLILYDKTLYDIKVNVGNTDTINNELLGRVDS